MVSAQTSTSRPRSASKRVGIFDVVRGLALVSMVGYHLCYDLVYLKGFSLPWFTGPFGTVWQRSIAWTFLFVAGCMCCLSRDNLKRSGIYALVAIAIFIVTTFAGVDTAINFGIFYCMAACTFVYWCISKTGWVPSGYAWAAVFFIVFLILFNLPHGSVGIGEFTIDVPRAPYDTGLLAWAGFPGPGFSSADYYPLLPYLFLFLTGASLGARWSEIGYPEWACKARLQPFTWLGQNSIIVYALHQPVILALLSLL